MNILQILIYILSATSLLCMIRVIMGPTHYDRLIAANLMIFKTTAIIATLAVLYDRHVYFDVALVYAILGYISVIAISKYLTGKELQLK